MRCLLVSRVFYFFLFLLMVDISSVSGSEQKLNGNNTCNLKPGRESCSKSDVNENERTPCAVSIDTTGRTGRERNQVVSRCEPIDRRFEFFILFLQIMRGAK